MTLHMTAIHYTARRQSDDRVIERIQESTTAALAEELRPLRWPLPVNLNHQGINPQPQRITRHG